MRGAQGSEQIGSLFLDAAEARGTFVCRAVRM